ncbi:hypothetical protein Tco_0077531 [Tanacetum coccineum]
MKGIEILSDAAQFELDLKKARKASKDDFFLQQCPKGSGEGSGVALEVPDGPSQSGPNKGSRVTPAISDEPSGNSSLESDDEIGDISSDDERSKADKTNKANEEKATEEKVVDEQIRDDQAKESVLERISKKKTKNEAKTTKPNMEWKRL